MEQERAAEEIRARRKSGAFEEIQGLQDLARDRSPAGRRLMLNKCATLLQRFLTDAEQDAIADIIISLLNQVDLSQRQILAGQVANNRAAPYRLVIALAHDKADVARPILTLNQRLKAVDLIYVVEHRSTAHRQIIARRPNLPQAVAAAIVDTQDADAIASLLYNPHAELPEALLQQISALAKAQPILRRPLLQREEIPRELSLELYWWVSDELRDYVERRFDVSPELLDEALGKTFGDLAKREEGNSNARLRDLAAKIAEADRISPGLLIQTLRHYNLAAFGTLFGHLSGLSHDAVEALLRPEELKNMAIASKATGLKNGAFATLLTLTRRSQAGETLTNPKEMALALEFYESLNEDNARQILSRWQNDPPFLMGGNNPVVQAAQGY